MGAHGAFTVLEGECAPSYLEVLLAPPLRLTGGGDVPPAGSEQELYE
jgi:hypothetical protein